jgi:phosphoglycerate dehydrogenase-like enzyme
MYKGLRLLNTVGVISLGMLGRLVCEHLRRFELQVLAYDPLVSAEEAARYGATWRTLDEIFRQADVVSLHTPWLQETEGLITGAHLASMKEGATLINTARGAIVREAEMIDVLQQRPDLLAVLDVTWPEPPLPGSPLYTLPNVILTPHIAGSLDAECQRMGQIVVEELQRFVTDASWSQFRAV